MKNKRDLRYSGRIDRRFRVDLAALGERWKLLSDTKQRRILQ